MILKNCPLCYKQIEDKNNQCPHCGYRFTEENDNLNFMRYRYNNIKQINCTFCGRANDDGSRHCGHCGKKLNLKEIERITNNSKVTIKEKVTLEKKPILTVEEKQQQILEKLQELNETQFNSMAKCPRCGSTSLVGNKKGFGIGKAVIGAAIFGPLGLVAGNIGAKKVRVTCIKCGNSFKV